MDLSRINAELVEEQPEKMTFRAASEYGRRLELAFSSVEGLRSDENFIVTFEEAIIFHLPGVLDAPVRFRAMSSSEARATIPSISFDVSEIDNPDGLTCVALVDANGRDYGYYLVAYQVQGKWCPG